MITDQEVLYNAYRDSGLYKNEDLQELLGWPNDKVRQMKSRLKRKGYIDTDYDGRIVFLKSMRLPTDTPDDFKANIYREMLEVYMDDFRTQGTFKDRLQVGQEIRMILKSI